MDQNFSVTPNNRAEAAQQRFLAQKAIAELTPVERSSPEVTPTDLSNSRAGTRRRIAHLISEKVAYATGSVDGLTDGIVNGAGELVESVVFFVSKVIHGVKHGWARGKFPNQ